MKKNGFTLVEVLAIIAILGIMVMIVFPNLNGSTENKKDKELEKLVNIIENAGKAYFSFNNDVYKIPVETLKSENYLTSSLIDPKTNEELDGCIRVILDKDDIYEYVYGSCENVLVPFDIELNGGTTTQNFESSYNEFTELELVEPEHPTMQFKEWKVVKGNSILKENKLTIGTTETILYAVYEILPSLEVDLNGGMSNINYNGNYKLGSIINLEQPTKEGYTFTGWTVTEGNSFVSGNMITIGSENTVIKANWEINNTIPAFTYTGSYQIVNDSDTIITSSTGNWKIRFLTSGTLTFTELRGASNGIDVFLVGGGGGGDGRSGGGGGYTLSKKGIQIKIGQGYYIDIGDGGTGGSWYVANDSTSGKSTSAFNNSVAGGNPGTDSVGGDGGSGGAGRCDNICNGAAGGSNGSNGGTGYFAGGKGQGTTTREFGETSGKLYAGGGGSGGSGGYDNPNCNSTTTNGGGGCGSGGSGGGGRGGTSRPAIKGENGIPNTGGGGGGGSDEANNGGGNGGSGIVIIRNKR